MSPTANLERHLMWDDIAILSRYLLMLSFNNCLDGKLFLYLVWETGEQLSLPSDISNFCSIREIKVDIYCRIACLRPLKSYLFL